MYAKFLAGADENLASLREMRITSKLCLLRRESEDNAERNPILSKVLPYDIFRGAEKAGTLVLLEDDHSLILYSIRIEDFSSPGYGRRAGTGLAIVNYLHGLAGKLGRDWLVINSTGNYGLLNLIYTKVDRRAEFRAYPELKVQKNWRPGQFLRNSAKIVAIFPFNSAGERKITFWRLDGRWRAANAENFYLEEHGSRLRLSFGEKKKIILPQAQFYCEQFFDIGIPVRRRPR